MLVGNLPAVPSQAANGMDDANAVNFARHQSLDWQLSLTAAFFDHCLPNQPGYSSSVAAVTIIPSSRKLSGAWRKWYGMASKARQLRFIREEIQKRRCKQQQQQQAAATTTTAPAGTAATTTKACAASTTTTADHQDINTQPNQDHANNNNNTRKNNDKKDNVDMEYEVDYGYGKTTRTMIRLVKPGIKAMYRGTMPRICTGMV